LAHDYARTRAGAFLLRIEDTDPGRARAEHVQGIIEDLGWLSLSWNGPVLRQSERLPLYAAALERLKKEGLIYPCFCTRAAIAAEIAASAQAPHGAEGPIYPGTCRRLSEAERVARVAREAHAWRLDVAAAVSGQGTLTWTDAASGDVPAEPGRLGDVVLARKDAPVSYHLAVTIDDAAQGVTDVVRGRDLFEATHIHRLLQALLELPRPRYHHHALLADAEGRRLAKRTGAPTLAGLREAGADPEALATSLREGRLPAGYSLTPS
jgi:glutamyl-Q tRNA(Asp) synthetase